jgi:DNA repair protein RadC
MAGGGTTAKNETAEGPAKHFHGHRARLRQRILKDGGAGLQEYELLELLLCAFIPRVDVKPIAKELIQKFGTVSGVFAAPPERLMETKGIGEPTAAYIRATNLLMQRAAGDQVKDKPVISNWAALLNYVRLALRHEKSEQARVLYLDRKNKLIADEIAGRGTVDHAPVYPREIAKRALELQASAVILVHNHPSGDPTPSKADVDLTRDIEKALAALDIRLHDHLVVGAADTVSMKAKGLI